MNLCFGDPAESNRAAWPMAQPTQIVWTCAYVVQAVSTDHVQPGTDCWTERLGTESTTAYRNPIATHASATAPPLPKWYSTASKHKSLQRSEL
jgi:hypothetical protein